MSLLIQALKEAERAKQAQTQQLGESHTPILTIEPTVALTTEPTATELSESDDDSLALFLELKQSQSDADEPELMLLQDDELAAPYELTAPSPELNLSFDNPLADVTSEIASSDNPSTTVTKIVEIPLEATPQKVSAPEGKENVRMPFHPREAISDFDKTAEAQKKAQSVFNAKRPSRNRRPLFIGTLSILGLLGVGFGYYWQISTQSSISLIQPATTAANLSPNAPTEELATQVQPTEISEQDADTPSQASTPSLQLSTAPERAATASIQEPSAIPEKIIKPLSLPHKNIENTAEVTAAPSSPARYDNQAIQIYRETKTDEINAQLNRAYEAFIRGELNKAQQFYQGVLQQEANNRDALLGMAAIALDNKQLEQAINFYTKLLELNPADPDATAGLVSLQINSDAAQSESYLKKALSQQPHAAAVHFALGNVYARQSRWAEAQQSYFSAHSAAPDNADYTFNLAVSLDRLNQGKLALDYYRRALMLARGVMTGFDLASAESRIQALQSLGQP